MFNRKMIKWLIYFISIVTLSCSDLIVSFDQDDNWIVKDSADVILHYRPENYSNSASPTSSQAGYILKAQNIYYQAIQDSIGRDYQDKVLIYLYNFDEALEKIGTNGGGHALPKFNSYYYTFIDSNRSITDHFGVVDPYVGAHELVHVITHRTLGYPRTKLMSEGYAVWLDGTFARLFIEDIISYYRDEQPDKILTPDNMLSNPNDYQSSVYYPNAGMFIKFLVRKYGIETVNSIFTVPADEFAVQLELCSGDSWVNVCESYSLYLDDL